MAVWLTPVLPDFRIEIIITASPTPGGYPRWRPWALDRQLGPPAAVDCPPGWQSSSGHRWLQQYQAATDFDCERLPNQLFEEPLAALTTTAPRIIRWWSTYEWVCCSQGN